MAQQIQLPCDNEGVCLICKTTPSVNETLTCSTCVTPWHIACLAIAAQSSSSNVWECPDCSDLVQAGAPAAGEKSELVVAIQAIEADASLTDKEKARKRQELVSGKAAVKEGRNEAVDMLHENFKCCVCFQLPDRPVTTPCGHNFCLSCFQKWTRQGKNTCIKCRFSIPAKMASQPRINSALVAAIRMARMSQANATGQLKITHSVHNQYRPDKAYTTDRAKRNGMANAASGRILVTTPADHFGPITAENDPVRKTGVLVGECWDLRMDCRQWGIHYPHVSGIAGQAKYGAQSVVLSGGYEDDEDHGEWFLYTGSGGRDLSGNKRTNKDQSFDQKFESYNESLRFSCKKGYPVRVVRSHKEKRSNYAPEDGLRYDGVYRIEKCWRKVGKQGFKVCRYLFVRCDNEPAPWTSDEHGDRPRPLPTVKELKGAIDIFERSESPSWDYAEEDNVWKWKKPPPASQKPVRADAKPEDIQNARIAIRKAETAASKGKLLKEFSCLLCKDVMTLPVTTPCAHNFCKSCLDGKFAGQSFTRERSRGGRTLRSQKNAMICPACPTDISDFLQNAQINRELQDLIEKLKESSKEANAPEESPEASSEDPNKENEVLNSEAETKNVEDKKRKQADAKPPTPTRNKKGKVDDNLLKNENAA
ncbi:E3 ubiquitin-protein ligase ORTHRUS 2-like isoform X1 [Apium graveolens]|uniref:E3 ubiquitin-protein ligase ORTHRUS 2-like isoform X1 n=1 Tax=Apium graveolens TaxID=4045 RepID=UPI003D79F89C